MTINVHSTQVLPNSIGEPYICLFVTTLDGYNNLLTRQEHNLYIEMKMQLFRRASQLRSHRKRVRSRIRLLRTCRVEFCHRTNLSLSQIRLKTWNLTSCHHLCKNNHWQDRKHRPCIRMDMPPTQQIMLIIPPCKRDGQQLQSTGVAHDKVTQITRSLPARIPSVPQRSAL